MKVASLLRAIAQLFPVGIKLIREEREIAARHVDGWRVKADATTAARILAVETRVRRDGFDNVERPVSVTTANAGQNSILAMRVGQFHVRIESADEDLCVRWGRHSVPWMPLELNEFIVTTYPIRHDWRPARLEYSPATFGGLSVRVILASDVERRLGEIRREMKQSGASDGVTSPGGQA